ncbi:MAG: 3-phosphoshikimate 1-carboxyvinyltransferase [Clostridia bacterium]|nr:3-phosphoshikimate 1-carboxyvinyltransferase [Clostridia bacterium]
MQRIVACGSRWGSVKAISSKSHVHRLLICAALADKKTVIRDVTFSKDIMATVACLNGYLADIFIDCETITVVPYKKATAGNVLNLNESGSTYRFLVPVACAVGESVSFTGAERLAQRPLSPLYELLVEHGACLSAEGKFPLSCSGRLTAGEFAISGKVSSQFISGLIFALPLLEGDSVIRITDKMESYPYIKMTLDAVRSFGISVIEEDNAFFIKGNQTYVSPREISAEGDWSNAAFFAVLGAFSQKGVEITNVDEGSLQGDKEIVEILKKMGAEVLQKSNSLFVKTSKMHGAEICAEQIPDLVPIVAVLACGAEGKTVISGAGRLRLKESDRIESVYQMIKNLGGNIEKTADGFIIEGNGSLSGGQVDSVNDHRIVMASSVAASICKENVTILCAEAVQKSYPAFFEDFENLVLE